jgi:lipoprotein-anchoring transpeptidase ErfK/SrfK
MVTPVRSVRGGWRVAGLLAGLLALGATAACGSTAEWQAPGSVEPGGSQEPGEAPAGPSALSFSPASGADGVSPVDEIKVELANGTLEAVTLTNSQGREVAGEFDAEKRTWTNSEELGYNKKYTVTAVGVGADGQRHEQTSTFTTVKPGNHTLPYLRANGNMLLDGGTFGVGQPIVVWFDEPIKDRAEAERSLSVTTDPEVEGAWRWMDNREVHWRPREYWPSGTKVTVEAKVYGKHFGGGLYGQEDRKASFTIGKKRIAIADENTKRMKVYIDDKLVKKINGRDVSKGIPISMGKGGTERAPSGAIVDYTTRSGPHVVTTKHEVYRMTSASFGITDKDSPNYYDEKIKKSIRISGAGEFVHLADWNIPAHGRRNTSHGCINVAPAYIYWFFDQFGAGDIVDVKNTSKKLPLRDGLGDWTLSWDKWKEGSALA